MELQERMKNNRMGKYVVEINKNYYTNKISCLFYTCRIEIHNNVQKKEVA